jgi:hypothetical protein
MELISPRCPHCYHKALSWRKTKNSYVCSKCGQRSSRIKVAEFEEQYKEEV